MNDTGTQEMLFYELSWSEITAPAKATLAYDTSGEYEYKRADVNHLLKVFLNDRVADPMAYFGESHEKILRSVGTGMCWMAINDWNDLPPKGAPACDGFQFTNPQEYNEDEFVFVTHSLGSRIVTDVFQQAAESVLEMIDKTSYTAQERNNQLALLDAQRNKEIRVYMLANQLPLLELGGSPPPVVGQMDAYCKRGGGHYDERFFSELSIIAFSDPNDPLSYALPAKYADDYMDSRLCPEIVNVSVNVVDAIDLFGLGEFVNPMAAHSSYEEDDRVIGLIVGGIGFETTDPAVAAECRWLETVDE